MRAWKKYLLGFAFVISFIGISPSTFGAPIKAPKAHNLSRQDSDAFLEKFYKEMSTFSGGIELKFEIYHADTPDQRIFGSALYSGTNGTDEFHLEVDGETFVLVPSTGQMFSPIFCVPLNIDQPIIKGFNITPRDLTYVLFNRKPMAYKGPNHFAGRAVQQFLSSEAFSTSLFSIHHTKIYIDCTYYTVLLADFCDSRNKLMKRICVQKFKNFDGIWMPKYIDFIVNCAGNSSHDRFEITHVHMSPTIDYTHRLY